MADSNGIIIPASKRGREIYNNAPVIPMKFRDSNGAVVDFLRVVLSDSDGEEGGSGVEKGIWTPTLKYNTDAGTPNIVYDYQHGEYEYFPDTKIVKVKGAICFNNKDATYTGKYTPLGIDGLEHPVDNTFLVAGEFSGGHEWYTSRYTGYTLTNYWLSADFTGGTTSLAFDLRCIDSSYGNLQTRTQYGSGGYNYAQFIKFEAIYMTY